MRNRLPPFESLRVFLVCIRRCNFSRAAEELSITPTAVSQRMRELERELGVQLFRRHGPKLTATDQARALAKKVEHGVALVQAAVDECRRLREPLRVTCAPTFATRWLLPRLAEYHALPGADALMLDNSQSLSPAGSFDVAIRNGVGPWPDYQSQKLMSEQRTPMLSPKWMQGGASIDAFLQVPLIPDADWPAWFRLSGVDDPDVTYTSTRYPNYELEAQAAIQGIGAALLSRTLFGDLIERGELIAPFPVALDGSNAYWLLWTQAAADSHFVKWIKSSFARETSN